MNSNQFIAHGEPVAINAASSGVDAPLRVRLAPIGDFPLRDGSKRHGAMQHCTREALVEVVENWKREGSPEILVDVDHASALGNGTEAAAWCSELATDADGLNGVLKLTPKGRELIAGRNYRFLSPAWTLSGDGTPVRLISVALTNTPNLPLPPVSYASEVSALFVFTLMIFLILSRVRLFSHEYARARYTRARYMCFFCFFLSTFFLLSFFFCFFSSFVSFSFFIFCKS